MMVAADPRAVRIISTALAAWEHDGDGDLQVTTLHVMRARHLLALLADEGPEGDGQTAYSNNEGRL